MKKRKDNGLKAIICLALATLAVGGASIAVSQMDNPPAPESGNGWKDGVYTAKTEATETGDYNYATVTIENGKITSVVWDEITGGASKKELSANGQYIMVEGNPIWKEQSESLGAYVVEHQTTDGIMNEDGYTDVVSGVSISVGGFVDLTNQAIGQAE